MDYHEKKVAAFYLHNLSAILESEEQLSLHHSVAQNHPVASFTLRVKSKCLIPACKVFRIWPLPHEPHLLALSLPHWTCHSCLLTVHEHIMIGDFSSVFFLPGTLIAKIVPWCTPSVHSLVPAQQPQTALLCITLSKESTYYQSHNPLINRISHLYLKVHLFVHILIECANSPCPYSLDKASWDQTFCQSSLLASIEDQVLGL